MYSLSPTFDAYAFRGLGVTLTDLAAAITRQEGACSAPGVCVNNNPGNLRAYSAAQPVDSRGIRIFPSFDAGYSALLSQEQYNINRGLTLSEFFAGKPGVYPGYAPAADKNNPAGYAANVAAWLGIPLDVPLTSIFGGSNVSGSAGTSAGGSGVVSGDWLGAESTATFGQDWVSGPSSQNWLSASNDGALTPFAWGALAVGAVGLALALTS